ncbi:MAG: 3-alpha,7-alpha, 12-alpha-trihydroxy-5-beta-cholest-24-enoyl-CoAhydratase, partial [Conexibacter sp.]|nr:3-alpha,7-alpha, 12-alpha-trihydroxy-5-beta-cholest-24-enoyl-CoAhydratase [Conexibacter sp.]
MSHIGPELVGRALAPVAWEWDERDAIIYALGTCARLPEDLEYLYEGRGPRVAATLPLAAVAHAFLPFVAALELDLRTLLHASQAIELRRVPAPAGAATLTRRITGVWDKGRAAMVDCEDVVEDASGVLAVARSAWWVEGAGGFGGPRSDPAGAAAPPSLPEDRAADLRAT